MKKRVTSLLVAAILSAVTLAGCNKNQPLENPEFTTDKNGNTIITEMSAKRAAAQRAELNAEEVEYTKLELSRDDGKIEYEVEFIHDGYEYEIEVDAEDGSINDFNKERLDRDDIAEQKNNVSAQGSNAAEAAIAENNTEPAASANNSAPPETVPSREPETSVNNEPEYIAREVALNNVLAKAELDVLASDLTKLEVEFELDDGIPEYEIDFEYGGYEYDTTVHAVTGEVIKFQRDKEEDRPVVPPQTDGNGTGSPVADIPVEVPTDTPALIEKEQALAFALAHAGLTEEEITLIYTELDVDDDDFDGVKYEYEIEFYCGYDEYDYEINAENGAVVDVDRDTEYGRAPEMPVEQPSEVIEEYISVDAAKAAAFAHAGVAETEIYGLEVELDRDDRIVKYEIEFKSGGYEYSYDVNAVDGSIFKSEKEFDD